LLHPAGLPRYLRGPRVPGLRLARPRHGRVRHRAPGRVPLRRSGSRPDLATRRLRHRSGPQAAHRGRRSVPRGTDGARAGLEVPRAARPHAERLSPAARGGQRVEKVLEPLPHGGRGVIGRSVPCARLDMSVDGAANAVEEGDVSGLPVGPFNPYGNAIAQTVTRLRSESQAGRLRGAARGRTWRVVSTEHVNRFGRPTGYTLYPDAAPTLLASPESSLHARAGFAAYHLWVTRYDPAQRYPAGNFVNQHPGG